MYGNISLNFQYFSPVAESNVQKTLLLLKTDETVFYFIFLDKKTLSILKNKKIYTCYTTD